MSKDDQLHATQPKTPDEILAELNEEEKKEKDDKVTKLPGTLDFFVDFSCQIDDKSANNLLPEQTAKAAENLTIQTKLTFIVKENALWYKKKYILSSSNNEDSKTIFETAASGLQKYIKETTGFDCSCGFYKGMDPTSWILFACFTDSGIIQTIAENFFPTKAIPIGTDKAIHIAATPSVSVDVGVQISPTSVNVDTQTSPIAPRAVRFFLETGPVKTGPAVPATRTVKKTIDQKVTPDPKNTPKFKKNVLWR